MCMQATVGALEFSNSFALGQDSSAIPARDFTLMCWARTPAFDPQTRDEKPYYQSLLTFATQATALEAEAGELSWVSDFKILSDSQPWSEVSGLRS